jgi:integrase
MCPSAAIQILAGLVLLGMHSGVNSPSHTSRHGTPVEPSNFDRSFNRRIAKAGVSKISRHSTRKTCGSLLAARDVHPRVAMQILRYSKIAITMEIYTNPLRPPAKLCVSSGNGSTSRAADSLLHFAAALRSTEAYLKITIGV